MLGLRLLASGLIAVAAFGPAYPLGRSRFARRQVGTLRFRLICARLLRWR